MAKNNLKPFSTQSPSTRVARVRFRRILIGILLVVLVWAVTFVNYNLIYAGSAEKISIQSGDVQLAGILVKPDTPGPHPAIVLLHGSGPQRYNKWYYRIHTNAFVRKGFAVLSYDQRGSGNSEGELKKTGFPDMVNDGIAAVDLLRSQPDINTDQIGLYAVSESGWYSPEIAIKSGKVAFIINRVSPPVSWVTTVLFEVENEALVAGVSEADIEEVLALNTRIYQFYIDAASDESVANGLEREAINVLLADTQSRPGFDDLFESALPDYDPETYSAKASKYSYDPYPFLKEINTPMLYIMGGKDVNVPFDESIAALERLKFDFGKDITIKTYLEASHYLYRWDWFPLEGLYVPGYLNLIGDWAKTHT